MRRPIEDYIVIGIIILMLLVTSLFGGWLCWSGILNRQDQSSCRNRGGNVEHVDSEPNADWRCVVGAPRRAP